MDLLCKVSVDVDFFATHDYAGVSNFDDDKVRLSSYAWLNKD